MPRVRQGILLELPTGSQGLRDSAFATNKTLPLHQWAPWIAGFSAQFVDDCLSKYLPSDARHDDWILDPFAGVGTTLVQAYRRGINIVGFEINPYAALAARLKLEAGKVSTKALAAQILAFERFMQSRCLENQGRNGAPRSKPPSGFSARTPFFSPAVERKVLFALDFIESIPVPLIRDLFRLAFGSVMVSVSNYSYEPSLTRRVAVDKAEIMDAAVDHVIASKLRLMLEDIESLQEETSKTKCRPRAQVFSESVFGAPAKLRRTGFISLAITSPPYLNNYHYPRNTRPQLHWLGLASGPGYKAAREEESFGKFWQTVRDLPPIDLGFRFAELQKTIDLIRSLNTERGSYGGPGWANYVATYFNDAYRFCKLLSDLLRPRGMAVIVLGNSIIQGVEVKTDYFFGEIAEVCGLVFKDRLLLREKRTGSSIISSSVRVDKAPTRTALYESAIVLGKSA